MDKKEIMNSMPSSKRGRKKLANSIRSETFSGAYPDEATKGPVPITENADGEESYEKEEKKVKDSPSESTAKETKSTSAKRKANTPKKKSVKTAATMDTPKEFTSFNCLKTTHTRTTVVSALLKKPIYELLDEAMDDYILRLKKSGKITVDI